MSCPICGKPVVQSLRPFCSKRCADLDLARWFNGSYAVASEDPDSIDELQEALDEAAQSEDKLERPH
ncbi:DNA gyrase inhibitor YacG [uncultured Roseobacter sp.]|uniref:DNA gyrase inhibitor YacG n=1 Tax=uncultured Roseobacter sp. TaxID=114847 RepID=UPI002626D07C|nr:DNA gyrase inhibitor YacG [uncultured Roseobacter sp.]